MQPSRPARGTLRPSRPRQRPPRLSLGGSWGSHSGSSCSAGLRRERAAGGRPGEGAQVSPAQARRPPPTRRGERCAASPPCVAPRGTAKASAARQARARPAPGLLGLALQRGDALRSLLKGKGWSTGCYVAGGLGEPGTQLTSSALLATSHLAPIPHPLDLFQFFRFPEAGWGRAQVIKVLLLPLPSRYTHHLHPGVRPGPETPSSRLKLSLPF